MRTSGVSSATTACLSCQGWLMRSFFMASGCPVSRPYIAARSVIREYTTFNSSSWDFTPRPSSSAVQSGSVERSRQRQYKRKLSGSANLAQDGNTMEPESSQVETPDQHDEQLSSQHETLVAEASQIDANHKTAETEASSSFIPWYLQGQQSDQRQQTQHVAAGQEMPAIPEHSPKLLEPIVDNVLNSLGLTHINVLDLRRIIDPPPALGANLFMVVATARSERHLHASADKLCRWLRSEYKLSPFADGLLGRNEMKIAIRRRVRRAKMMSAVGARADEGDVADGLRSGWICVNVGRVEGGMLPEDPELVSKIKVIGFGTTSTTSTIVVQMLTEDKREEMDLEGLWSTALRRQIRKQDLLINGEEPEPEEPTKSDEIVQDSLSVLFDNKISSQPQQTAQRASW